MVISATLESPVRGDRRRLGRRPLRLKVMGSVPETSTATDVLIHNLSVTGLLIETAATLAVDEEIEFDLPEAAMARGRIVWTSGQLFGCQFVEPIAAASVSAALLRTPFEPAAAPPPREEFSRVSLESDSGPVTDLSLRARLAILLGLSLALWAFIILIVVRT